MDSAHTGRNEASALRGDFPASVRATRPNELARISSAFEGMKEKLDRLENVVEQMLGVVPTSGSAGISEAPNGWLGVFASDSEKLERRLDALADRFSSY